MSQPNKANYFYGIICKRCKYPIVLFNDESKGTAPFDGEGLLSVTCPNLDCRNHHDYEPTQVLPLRVEV